LSAIAEYTKRHLVVVFGTAILMALLFAAILYGIPNSAALSVIFFIVGILCAYQIIAIYLASTFVPVELAGLTSAVANVIIMTFGYIFHTSIGKVIAIARSMGHSEMEAYQLGIGVIPVALGISILGIAFLLLRFSNRRIND
jgi:hypothetical protein